jgi:glutamate/tyrosine decarboxylase-like PLP-dependent enzyme
MELLAPVDLSVVCFRYLPAGASADAANAARLNAASAARLDAASADQVDALNKAIMEEVQASGDSFLTQTSLDGRFSLRACVVHYATTEADLLALLDAVRRAGRKLA